MNIIKEYRLKRRLTQGECAAHMGWGTAQFWSNIERGESSFPADSYKRMNQILRMPQDKFIKYKLSEYEEEIKRKMK